jgi:hypothetical protein
MRQSLTDLDEARCLENRFANHPSTIAIGVTIRGAK